MGVVNRVFLRCGVHFAFRRDLLEFFCCFFLGGVAVLELDGVERGDGCQVAVGCRVAVLALGRTSYAWMLRE